MTASACTRPIVRYHGGKWRIAPWIISHFPAHRVYVEPFGGAASVLLRKEPSTVEVYNDLNSEMVSVFRVLRDPANAQRLAEVLRATPCSEAEFHAAYETSPDPVEQARRTIIRGMQGHGSTGCSGGKRTGWRRGIRGQGTSGGGGNPSSREWSEVWAHVGDWADRMRTVFIECQDSALVMKRWDAPDALHYVDPPYPSSTRTTGSKDVGYAHEMSDGDHQSLSLVLRSLRGAVVLSGYTCPLYAELYPDWKRIDRRVIADHGAKRTESIWLNPSASLFCPSPCVLQPASRNL